MARAESRRLLEEALRIRRTQQQGAELALGRARARAEEQAERRDAQALLLADLQASWTVSIQGRAIDVGLATAWLAAIGRGETELALREQAADDAEQARAAARGDLVAAIGRVEATAGLARSARRVLDRSREEAALAENDDRNARARGGS